MLKFKIFEIPEGQSVQNIKIEVDELELGVIPFLGANVEIDFYRSEHFIRTKFKVDANVQLICDRSLDEFSYPINKSYEVLFKADNVEESAEENGAIRNYDHKRQQIDLEQDVIDTILLDIPVKKLHPRFLDDDGNPKEFVNQIYGDTDPEEEIIDPRWEALKELKK